MAQRVLIAESAKGAFQENDDSWYLVIDDDGTKMVLHEWDHVDIYKNNAMNVGEKTYTIEEALQLPIGLTLKKKLAELG